MCTFNIVASSSAHRHWFSRTTRLIQYGSLTSVGSSILVLSSMMARLLWSARRPWLVCCGSLLHYGSTLKVLSCTMALRSWFSSRLRGLSQHLRKHSHVKQHKRVGFVVIRRRPTARLGRRNHLMFFGPAASRCPFLDTVRVFFETPSVVSPC